MYSKETVPAQNSVQCFLCLEPPQQAPQHAFPRNKGRLQSFAPVQRRLQAAAWLQLSHPPFN